MCSRYNGSVRNRHHTRYSRMDSPIPVSFCGELRVFVSFSREFLIINFHLTLIYKDTLIFFSRNPLWICPVFMYSLPAWKEQFKKAFPSFSWIKRERKLGVVNVETVEDVKKKRISMETDVHFIQLNEFWT